MSHELITVIDDDDSLQQQQPRQQQGQQQQQQSEELVCIACTFRNGSGATVCSVCETPLVDDAQRKNGHQAYVEQQYHLLLGAANCVCEWLAGMITDVFLNVYVYVVVCC